MPSQSQLQDIEKGKSVLMGLSQFDIGQALVIEQGLVLGIEAIEGTDALIQRCALLKRNDGLATSPLLIKMSKLRQDKNLDLPTIGLHTIKELARLGYGGLAIEADRTLIVDKIKVVEAICHANLFLYAFPSPMVKV